MDKIGKILLFVVIAGVVLYFVTSGILSNGIAGFNALVAPKSTSTSAAASTSTSTNSFFDFNFGSFTSFIGPPSSSGTSLPPSLISAPAGNGAATPTPRTINPSDIPQGFTAAQLSPYFHEVRFGSVAPATNYSMGTITLNNYLNPDETVDITGWQIKSRVSGEYIPQAIDVYDPSGLTPPSDIRVKNNDIVYLYSTSAPFNLRINECIGYIAHVAQFTPPLPNNCPYVDRSQIENLSGACQNYISSIGSCQSADANDPRVPRNDYACEDYLNNNFTYRTCFESHASDADFLSNQVWVWMGSNVLDQYHDQVELLDRNGLLVDYYSY